MTFTKTPSSIEDKPRVGYGGGIGRDPAWEGGLKGVKIARKLAVGSRQLAISDCRLQTAD
jgi:hypothetical protein